MPAAVVQCIEVGVTGNFNIDVRDMFMVDVFITEAVGPPPADNSPIAAEIVRARTTSNSDSDIANVRLVE
jgi:hypothetical protein